MLHEYAGIEGFWDIGLEELRLGVGEHGAG
jgi:hypothetical protein